MPRRVAALAIGGAIAALSALATGCMSLAPRPEVRPGAFAERTVVFSIEGTSGIGFEGSYGTATGSTAVRGRVPAQFTVKTRVAAAGTFTKTQAEGVLSVRVLVDGTEVFARSTSAPYGTVLVTRAFGP